LSYFKKYFYTLFLILGLLALAWVVSLQLVQQRVQLEAEGKLKNVFTMKTPLVWNFNSFTDDVVESFQIHWQSLEKTKQIYAVIGSNPALSLNFSGERINTNLHSKLHITFAENIDAKLVIQYKTELDSEFFYYLTNVKLNKKNQVIDLNRIWKRVSAEVKGNTPTQWNDSSHQISSLVLQFNNPNSAITIDSISLPYSLTPIKKSEYTIDCSMTQLERAKPLLKDINVFQLQETCIFPSNYLWLKQQLQNKFPESILTLKNRLVWQKAEYFKVNQSFTNNYLINSLLYLLIALFVLLAFKLMQFNRNVYHVNEAGWLHSHTSRMLKSGVKRVIKPYHLFISYAAILLPTLLALLLMTLLKFPNLEVFKKFPLYFLWAIMQQFFLVYVLAQLIFYRKTQNRLVSALLAGFVFSLFHLPSLTLMLATFVAGSIWSYGWLVFKKLIPLALSHALLAMMFYYVISDKYLYSAKVLQWFFE
jgi:hypothetical protein